MGCRCGAGCVLGGCAVGGGVPGTVGEPAVDLSASPSHTPDPRVATAADGTTTVIWNHFSDGCARHRAGQHAAAGGALRPVRRRVRPRRNAGGAQVAVAPDGTTTGHPERLPRHELRRAGQHAAARRHVRPRPSICRPRACSPTRGPASRSPRTAPTTAVWGRLDGANYVVQASTRPPGGRFGPPVRPVRPRPARLRRPQVAAAADGTTTAVWGPATALASSCGPARGGPAAAFGAPVTAVRPRPGGRTPEAGGRRRRHDHRRLTSVSRPRITTVAQASTRPPGGRFGAPVSLSAPGGTRADPRWRPPRTAPPPSSGIAPTASCRPARGGPAAGSAPRSACPPRGQNAYDTQVAVAPDGTTTAVWVGFNGTKHVVQASTRPPGGTFGAPVTVSATASRQHPGWRSPPTAPPPSSGRPRRRAGQYAAAPRRPSVPRSVRPRASPPPTRRWRSPPTAPPPPSGGASTAGSTPSVRRRSPPTRPRHASAPIIAGSPRVGRTLRCRPGAFTGAASITTTWLRGATPIATGPSYRITTADRGAALACRTRGSNPYGSIDSRSRALRIPPGPPIPPGPAKKAPVARSLPTVTGTPRVGRTLRCRPGAFTGATSTSTSWLRGSHDHPGRPHDDLHAHPRRRRRDHRLPDDRQRARRHQHHHLPPHPRPT